MGYKLRNLVFLTIFRGIMKINEKIRALREVHQWSQEEMAEKVQMSKNGYARLERGEGRLDFARLEKIADIFNLDIVELITSEEKNFILQIIGNDGNNTHYGNDINNVANENMKFKMLLQHKDEVISYKDIIISQKDDEIIMLKSIIELLQSKK